MINYILFSEIDFLKLKLSREYAEWLKARLDENCEQIELGSVSASICIQGVLSELLLFGKCKTDWLGIIKHYLEDEKQMPLAYSSEYGKKLYKFNHWKQTTIHAIHAHWWIKKQSGIGQKDLTCYEDLIEEFIQPNGWIYNPEVSNTGIATRMKSELTMSVAMGLEIIGDKILNEKLKKSFEATLCSMPFTGYLGAEYFRLRALRILGSTELAPAQIRDVLETCRAGEGYCDFSIESKVDDYMGTAKRTSRDKATHSAISGLHAKYIADFLDKAGASTILKLKEFGLHLKKNPFDMPAFKMRDIDIPFGEDVTPFEIMAASYLISGADE